MSVIEWERCAHREEARNPLRALEVLVRRAVSSSRGKRRQRHQHSGWAKKVVCAPEEVRDRRNDNNYINHDAEVALRWAQFKSPSSLMTSMKRARSRRRAYLVLRVFLYSIFVLRVLSSVVVPGVISSRYERRTHCCLLERSIAHSLVHNAALLVNTHSRAVTDRNKDRNKCECDSHLLR